MTIIDDNTREQTAVEPLLGQDNPLNANQELVMLSNFKDDMNYLVAGDTAPTFVPTRPMDRVKIFQSGAITRVYFWLTETSTWDYVSLLSSPDILPVSNGGTGASTFTDHGVLIGNVGGAIQATTAGTAGQVLTSNGSSADPTFQDNEGYTVNANESTKGWLTTMLESPEGIAGLYGWSVGGTPVKYANGSQVSTNVSISGIHTTGFYDALLGNTTNRAIEFADNRTIKTKFSARTATPTGTTGGINAFIGYGPSAAGSAGDLTDTATVRVGFAFYDSSIYAVSCNGTNITSTFIQAYAGTLESFTLKLNGTSSADFYINGTLATSISTNIPSASSKIKIMLGGQNGGGGGCGFTFLSNFITSQKAI